MIIHDVEQGTTPWLELRAGIPTSSEFGRIVTPTGKPSSSAKSYMFELMAERLMGHPVTSFVTTWMERGHELEPEAVDFYAFQTNEDPQPVGFVTDDSKRVGASPDRWIRWTTRDQGSKGIHAHRIPFRKWTRRKILPSITRSTLDHRKAVGGHLFLSPIDASGSC